MRDLLRHLATETGELIWAIDESRLSLAERAPAQGSAGIAVVGLYGPLTPRSVSYYGRIVSPGMDAFRAQMLQAGANPEIAAVVIDVNSPGGTWAGTPETAQVVRQVAEQKPVVAMVDTLCASAAYFIASQAGQIVATPSGEVGSIGVMGVHIDLSKALEEAGIKATVFRSRASKGSMLPYEPLTEETKAAVQASVDAADAEFLKAVAQGRKMSVADVRRLVDENGLGRAIDARQAMKLGLVDRVATMGELLYGMIKTPKAAAGAGKRRSSLVFD
jgi:signal peptide peptidase SppA